ncbi:MAG TPA: SAM-dependent methyltransferase [Pseudonocardiaceae bacterium]|jgi:N-methyltransferase|nr:SAM-dependent methyltransferase [Pseudonocardiaceae bacterium]
MSTVEELAGDINAVGWTAFGMAWTRARESRQAQRWFTDPLAESFLDTIKSAAPFPLPPYVEPRGEPAADRFLRMLGDYAAVRTRFFDDYFRQACAAGCRQAVILAAGLDARGYRLDWPAGTRLFELDVPAVLRFKQRVIDASGIEPTCERVTVEVDLRTDWLPSLRAAGLRTDEPIAWLVEGLLLYLSDESSQRLLRALTSASPAGSRLAVEHTQISLRELPMFAVAAQGLGQDPAELWPGGLAEEPTEWLAGEGWQAQAHDPAALAVDYGRSTPALLDPAQGGGPFSALVSAQR